MNKLHLFFLTISCFFYSNSYSQSDFKITVNGPIWSNPTINSVDLRFDMVVKNVGNETGICEDLGNIRMVCTNDYKTNNRIYVKAHANIYESLLPGDSVIGFMKFSVPLDADSLTIIVSGDENGATKFISRSYNYVQTTLHESQYKEALNEAKKRFYKPFK